MRGMFSVAVLAIVLKVVPGVSAHGEAPKGYYRQPTIHGDTIVFVAEGDLWKVGIDGGVATRITTHAGDEASPRISPDGTWLAFTGEYEGPTEVYVMPMEGGLPKRLTYDSSRATVAGWKGGQVIASTTRFSTLPSVQLTLIDPETGAREVIPLAQASDGCYDDAGETLYFTRLQFQGSVTKRYKGGTAQNLWKFSEGAAEAVPMTADFAGTSTAPMWRDGRVYFACDRDGTMEVWSMTPDSGDLKQHSKHDVFDIQSPALSGGRIVYQHGQDLWIHDLVAGTDRELDIRLGSDFDQTRERWVSKPMDYVTAAHLSPDGERVVLTARGQVFVAPRSQGRLVEISTGGKVRHRDARFMPDGNTLLSLSDQSGEVELWTLPSNGVGDTIQTTSDGTVLRWEAIPSPDGKWIAHHDKNQRLWLLETATGQSAQIAESAWENIEHLKWSHDSGWLAFVQTMDNLNRQVMIVNVDTKVVTPVTTDRYDSSDPSWSPDGKFLYFLSERHFDSVTGSPWGRLAPEPFFDRRHKIYHVALKADPTVRSPFQPADELHVMEEKARKEKEKKDKEKKETPAESQPATQTAEDSEQSPAVTAPESQPSTAPASAPETQPDGEAVKVPPVEIDLEGIAARLMEVPLPAGNYSALDVTEDRLLWMSRVAAPPKPEDDNDADLMTASIANKDVEAKTLVKGIASFERSGDGKSLLIRRKDAIFIIDAAASAPASLDDKQVKLSGWTFPIVPRDEWRQMFIEAWRLERDYFYDLKMHGVEWKATLDRYLPLVDRVSTREELSDLIAQMVAELSALHTFVRGGDLREGNDKIAPASLGGILAPDPEAGGLRVERVYRSDPDQPELRSPLAMPGVEVKEGDVIVRINGRMVATNEEASALLRNQAGKQVLLSVKPRVSAGEYGETREVIVTPFSMEADSDRRYHEWEYTRRLGVEAAGAGDLGYVHIRAMGRENFAEFARGFYPVFNRKGLIIDVRHNRGGNIDSWLLSRLMRKAWFYWQPRVGEPYWNMQYAFRGHLVVLCNERTASDGEAFAEGIKRLQLGTLIGTRTWGGEIWLSSSNVLVDKGIATAAEIGVYGPEGAWLIEGHGVEPDIVVDNLPHATFSGEDAQLDAAIDFLKKKIVAEPVEVPKAPAHPDKSFRPTP